MHLRRYVTIPVLISKVTLSDIILFKIRGDHTGLKLSEHLHSVMDRFNLNNGRVLGITTDNASSNYSMVKELQASLKAMEVEWSAAQNHIPCMAHVIQLALSAFIQSLGVKGRSKSWEDGVCDSLMEDRKGKKAKAGSVRVKKIVDMPAGFFKIIEKVKAVAPNR